LKPGSETGKAPYSPLSLDYHRGKIKRESSMSHNLSSGIISAAILPFEENGAIDWKTLDRYIVQVAAGKPRAIAMNMAVSEVSSLEISEQLEVIRRCKASLAGGCTLLSGVNATHTAAAVEYAKRVVDAGAEGLVIFPPVPAFLSAPSISMIVDYHQSIADAVKVPMLAFQTNFCNYPRGTITALSQMSSIVAIKDASFSVEQTLDNVKEAAAAKRKIGSLTGSDTFILEAMLMGCDGALIGFAATATAELVRMHTLATQGKITEAYEIWGELGPLARICWRQPLRDYRVRTKYTLVKQGVLSNFKVRAPFPDIADADRADIDTLFEKTGVGEARFLPAGSRSASKISAAAS
jgi:4-hydroxy-tetrahydrodipicolinate synthase